MQGASNWRGVITLGHKWVSEEHRDQNLGEKSHGGAHPEGSSDLTMGDTGRHSLQRETGRNALTCPSFLPPNSSWCSPLAKPSWGPVDTVHRYQSPGSQNRVVRGEGSGRAMEDVQGKYLLKEQAFV